MFFRVLQGNILGPVLFILFVAELANRISSVLVQYVDETTVYRHCKNGELYTCIVKIERDVGRRHHGHTMKT